MQNKDPDFEIIGPFMARNGRAFKKGAHSQKKLCFVATDQALLREVLLELSNSDHCYWVKYSINPKEGMFLGRCFLTEDQIAGQLWDQFKKHPKLMCTIQDDTFTSSFRT